jgi:hypothetical protein
MPRPRARNERDRPRRAEPPVPRPGLLGRPGKSRAPKQELETTPTPTGIDQTAGTEFERFKALTQDLLRVPKAELERGDDQG